jgi:hypothetical protein
MGFEEGIQHIFSGDNNLLWSFFRREKDKSSNFFCSFPFAICPVFFVLTTHSDEQPSKRCPVLGLKIKAPLIGFVVRFPQMADELLATLHMYHQQTRFDS